MTPAEDDYFECCGDLADEADDEFCVASGKPFLPDDEDCHCLANCGTVVAKGERLCSACYAFEKT
jgi:hypothetical protein